MKCSTHHPNKAIAELNIHRRIPVSRSSMQESRGQVSCRDLHRNGQAARPLTRSVNQTLRIRRSTAQEAVAKNKLQRHNANHLIRKPISVKCLTASNPIGSQAKPTTENTPKKKGIVQTGDPFLSSRMERKRRFELPTLSLARRCSTTEPLPLALSTVSILPQMVKTPRVCFVHMRTALDSNLPNSSFETDAPDPFSHVATTTPMTRTTGHETFRKPAEINWRDDR